VVVETRVSKNEEIELPATEHLGPSRKHLHMHSVTKLKSEPQAQMEGVLLHERVFRKFAVFVIFDVCMYGHSDKVGVLDDWMNRCANALTNQMVAMLRK
jgi:hypothetical protein